MSDNTNTPITQPDERLAPLPRSRSLVLWVDPTQTAPQADDLLSSSSTLALATGEGDPVDLAALDAEIREDIRLYIQAHQHEEAAKTNKAERRVILGTRLTCRQAVTPYGQWTGYLKSLAVEEYKWRTSYTNMAYALLHNKYDWSIARLANSNVKAVEAEAAKRTRTYNEDFLSRMQRVFDKSDNSVQAAQNLTHNLNYKDRRTIADSMLNYDTRLFQEQFLRGILRRGDPVPAEQQHLGLTNLMVDSGAYTAMTQDRVIDIDKYINFLKANPWITTYFVLDIINSKYPAQSAALSWENFQYMRAQGLDPIPVFHVREGMDYLHRYLDAGCTYIALAASASKVESPLFFDACFEKLQVWGSPIRTHALGVADRAILRKYPFDTSDSATWALHSLRYDMCNVAWLNPYNETEADAARVYLEIEKCMRLDREVREYRPDFHFHVVMTMGNDWALPALHLLPHRKVMISYHGLSQDGANQLKAFIDYPEAVLQQDRYREKAALLLDMKQRIADRMLSTEPGVFVPGDDEEEPVRHLD